MGLALARAAFLRGASAQLQGARRAAEDAVGLDQPDTLALLREVA